MPAFCFARPVSFELEIGGRKLVGSAQRRQGTAFLQHGAIMLGAAPARLRRVFPGEGDPLAGMTTLESALGKRPSFDEAAAALAEGFRRAHGLDPSWGACAKRRQPSPPCWSGTSTRRTPGRGRAVPRAL
jgi:lipoate-protein ligase A